VSWGQMLQVAQTQYATAWWTALFPGICVAATVFGFSVLGDSISRLLNPTLRK
jgi:peptide/nickel transport system permease protein